MSVLTTKSFLSTGVLMASVLVGVLVVSLGSPSLSYAASPKVDVCHREGNGSFHLITVAYQAVQAHRAHGDALPGEAVPGNAGYNFDDTCAQVVASLCPCDFSLAHLATAGIDGQAGAFICFDDSSTLQFLKQFSLDFSTSTEALVDPPVTKYCSLSSGGIVSVRVDNLTSDQVQACGDDLRAAAATLGATSGCGCSGSC